MSKQDMDVHALQTGAPYRDMLIGIRFVFIGAPASSFAGGIEHSRLAFGAALEKNVLVILFEKRIADTLFLYISIILRTPKLMVCGV
jgi:hypothetical protein